MEPAGLLAGVEGCEGDDVTADLQHLYAGSYPRLVSVVGLVVGDRSGAEDLVQETFARLLPRWEQVSAYDDPVDNLRFSRASRSEALVVP